MHASRNADPLVRSIGARDVVEALIRGLRDFQAAPRFGLLFGLLYAVGGIAILVCLGALGMTGFAIIGPFVALGLYEVSRRLEKAEPISLATIWKIRPVAAKMDAVCDTVRLGLARGNPTPHCSRAALSRRNAEGLLRPHSRHRL